MPDQHVTLSPAAVAARPPDTQTDADVTWRQIVDRSARLPVFAFVVSAVAWLLLGSLFALLASLKLDFPDWLTGQRYLTFGVVRPAHLNAMIYGWISMASIAVMLWLWGRLLKTPLRGQGLLLTAAGLWNLGLTIGIIGILSGGSRSVEWLEMPDAAFVFIIPALLLIAAAMLQTLSFRQMERLYISVWYLGAAVVWMPFLLLAILVPPYTGVPHATAGWWFAHNMVGLWLTPVGLAAAYYFIPKVTGQPVYSYNLAYLGFWTLALFYGWTGVSHLVGGPVPQWVETVSITFSILMVIPVAVVAVNHHMTIVGHFRQVRYSPTLRFVVFGAISYTAVSLQGALQSLRFWQELTHFTQYTIAHSHLGVYAFATMVAFGSLYYIMPRVTGWEWSSPKLVSLHFWASAGGVLLMFGALTTGGLIQGFQLLDPQIEFTEIVKDLKPWLFVRSISGFLLTAGHIVFAYLLYKIMRRKGELKTGPTYFRPMPAPTKEKHEGSAAEMMA